MSLFRIVALRFWIYKNSTRRVLKFKSELWTIELKIDSNFHYIHVDVCQIFSSFTNMNRTLIIVRTFFFESIFCFSSQWNLYTIIFLVCSIRWIRFKHWISFVNLWLNSNITILIVLWNVKSIFICIVFTRICEQYSFLDFVRIFWSLSLIFVFFWNFSIRILQRSVCKSSWYITTRMKYFEWQLIR